MQHGTRIRMEFASRVPPGLVDEQRAVSLAWIVKHFNPEIGPPAFIIAERDVVGGAPADVRPRTYSPWQQRGEPDMSSVDTRVCKPTRGPVCIYCGTSDALCGCCDTCGGDCGKPCPNCGDDDCQGFDCIDPEA